MNNAVSTGSKGTLNMGSESPSLYVLVGDLEAIYEISRCYLLERLDQNCGD